MPVRASPRRSAVPPPDRVARVALLPLLVAQGLSVRRRALRLPEAAGPRTGSAGSGPPLRLLILGDSSAAGVGVAHQDHALSGRLVPRLAATHRVEWHVLARTGKTTEGALAALASLDGQRFDAAVTGLGVNDVTGRVPLPLWLARQAELAGRLQAEFGVRALCLSGLPPMDRFPLLPQPLRWVLGAEAARFDRHLAGLVADLPGARHVPLDFDPATVTMAEDGFHPGPSIYDAWAERVAAAMRELLA